MLSDEGGDLIIIAGNGFSEDLDLHFFAANRGLQASESNQLLFTLKSGNIQLTSPAVLMGEQYQIVLVRNETEEIVNSPTESLLITVDDTLPTVTVEERFEKQGQLVITADEPILTDSVRSFSVIKEIRDYSDLANTSIDISDRFDDLVISGNSVTLRLHYGDVMEANAVYTIVITGIRDASGNKPLNHPDIVDGNYSSSYQGVDTLAPVVDYITLLQKNTGMVVDASTVLTAGASYQFGITAHDNFVQAESLAYYYRISYGNSSSSNSSWMPLNYYTKTLAVDVESDKQLLTIEVKVQEGSRSGLKSIPILLKQPMLELSGGLNTVPSIVQESMLTELSFTLQGDLDLVKNAKIRVFDDGTWVSANYNSVSGQISLNYLTPRITDILGKDVSPVAVEVPVIVRVAYGITGNEQLVDYSAVFTLHPDSEAPTLSFVFSVQW